MVLNGSGIIDMAMILKISPTAVIETLKKAPHFKAVNEAYLAEIEPTLTTVNFCQWQDIEVKANEM